jgi:FAD/FMN-containing dehydrogenase
MDSSHSFKQLFIQSLILLTPAFAAAQNTTALQACLTAAGVQNIIEGDSTWSTETAAWQLRLKPDPAAMAYPADKAQLASSLACAREASVKVSALAGGHSFAAYGFGDPGNLVVNMAAFNSMSVDNSTGLFTYGAGVRVGPGAKYLWDNTGRHFPHVRHGRPGLAGSSIGGGFGSTSRFLGTPMDNLESVEYMLYNGTIVQAGKGSDLFWAAQGAGSSFGILTSLTTNTWKPTYQTAINFTLSLGALDIETGANALLDLQEYALSDAPDEFAIRWGLSAPPYTGTGYYYGDPKSFDTIIAPLMERMPAGANLTKSEFEFFTLDNIVAPGLTLPNGGTSPGRAMYTQALTMTTDNPLTYDLIHTLYNSTTYSFNRTDLRKSGFLDLWGGVSRDIEDCDTSYAHGKNLWLIRWEANAVNASNFPQDGVQYLKNQMLPFEEALTEQGIPLRGFANYRDTALTEAQWSERLYGKENYARLKKIKAAVDPEALFTSNAQSIPLP